MILLSKQEVENLSIARQTVQRKSTCSWFEQAAPSDLLLMFLISLFHHVSFDNVPAAQGARSCDRATARQTADSKDVDLGKIMRHRLQSNSLGLPKINRPKEGIFPVRDLDVFPCDVKGILVLVPFQNGPYEPETVIVTILSFMQKTSRKLLKRRRRLLIETLSRG